MAEAQRDLVVVGGGIHGVGVAQAAAARGWSVLLLEQDELASGTSSRSSKLIHGGLRYLESGHLGLVRQSLRERRLLLRLAPDLVRLRPLHVPIYEQTRRRPWQIRAGLSIYALLGGLERDARFSHVPRRRWDELGGLEQRGLVAIYRFFEGQTDDALLTRAVARSAQALGVEIAVPARLVAARIDESGCTIDYDVTGAPRTCRALALINAAGPWVEHVRAVVDPAPPARPIELIQGTHLLVNGAAGKAITYVEAPQDGRPVFVMPWRDATLVGTTETPFTGSPADVGPLDAEIEYLSTVLAHYFPDFRSALPRAVRSAFAGLRVLPVGNGLVNRRTRETAIECWPAGTTPRVVSIYGGKLTTYRATAEAVVRRLARTLPARRRVARTDRLPLEPPP